MTQEREGYNEFLIFLNDVETYFMKIKDEEGVVFIEKLEIRSQKSEEIKIDNSILIIEEKLPMDTDMGNKADIKRTIPTFLKHKDKEFHFQPFSSKDLFTEQPEWQKASSLDELYNGIFNCTNCPLGFTRKKFVFGMGNPKADIMFIGEAPGADEDEQGLPFVGRAGQLLTKIIESIQLKREDVYIANIIKCRPPGNRQPFPNEVDECEPYLYKQIELIKPAFIVALGLTALDTLFKQKHKMGEMRGKLLDFHGIPLLVTYHPAALLRNPGWKKDAWEDVKLLRRLYDEWLAN